MIYIVFILVIVLLILMISNQSTVKQNLNFLSRQVADLRIIIDKQSKLIELLSQKQPVFKDSAEKKAEEIITPVIEKPVINKEALIVPPVEKTVKEPVIEKPEKITETQNIHQTVKIPEIKKTATEPVTKKKKNIEKFIGEQLVVYFGIGITVLGIGFFVKWAIDKGWLNEAARVGVGLLSGGILLGIAHFFRNKYRAFSSVLVGGGIAVCYITIAIGFQMYNLFSQTGAFLIMVLITLLAICLSLFYKRRELAIVAIVGGFITPFMVSTGDGNYKVLFTYIMILDVGMLILAFFKKWREINIISFIFTAFLFGGWLAEKVLWEENAPYSGALLFGILFYITFFLMNIINNLAQKQKFIAIEIILIILNASAFYAAGMLIYEAWQPTNQGIFTFLLAIFNGVFALLLYKNTKFDRNLFYLLLAIVMIFLSLTAPAQFDGNIVTLFWMIESVGLLWFALKSEMPVIKLGSGILMFIGVISLLSNWFLTYIDPAWDDPILKPVTNKAFITSIISLICIFLYRFFLKNDKQTLYLGFIPQNNVRNILSFIFVLFIYFSFLAEISYHVFRTVKYGAEGHVIISCYNTMYLLAVVVWSRIKQIKYIFEISTIFSVVYLLIFISFYLSEFSKYRDLYVTGDILSPKLFVFQIAASASAICLAYFLWKNIQRIFPITELVWSLFLWYSTFIMIFVLSAEITTIWVLKTFTPDQYISMFVRQSIKIGWPILWSVLSFVYMFTGMKLPMRDLRILSLTLFSITIFKLFVFDISDAPEGGKIAAFISLGVLLLVIAFLYQKLRKLIFKDDEENENNNSSIRE